MSKIKKKHIIKIAIILILICVIICGYFLYKYLHQNYIIPYGDEKVIAELRKEYDIGETYEHYEEPDIPFVYVPTYSVPLVTDKVEEEEEIKPEEKPKEEPSKLTKLMKEYEQVKGWIKIPNTVIDYPVVQGTNNDYYLKHNYKNEWNYNGSIFLDYAATPDAHNIVVYGHNMQADLMFTEITKYKKKKFGLENSEIYFDLNNGTTAKWHLVGAFATHQKYTYKFSSPFFSESTIEQFLSDIESYKYYDTDYDYSANSQFLTLITCSYEKADYRTVVIFARG